MPDLRRILRAPRLIAWSAAATAALALSCTFLIETRGTQCSQDADCAAFPMSACDTTQHVCVPQACASGGCVCTPATPVDILNACPLGDCHAFDNSRVTDAGASGDAGAGGAPAPTFSCPGGTGGSAADGGDAGALPVCETLSSPLYLIGPGSIVPLFAWVAQLFAKDGTTVIFQNDSSCVGVKKMFLQTEFMENDPGNEAWTTYFDAEGNEHACVFKAGNIRPHIGLSDVFAQTCGYDTNSTDPRVVDTAGPVQAFGFAVPSASTETAISAEAALAVYRGGAVTPWVDVRYVFQRSSDSGTQNMIGTTLGLNAGSFQATSSISSDDEAQHVGCSPKPAETLGILAVDLVQSGMYPIRLLAYQHFQQTCSFLPDSSPTANDKRNVRNGHYYIWGPAHLFTRNDEPNAKATEMINYVSGIVPPPSSAPDIFQVWTAAHLVPQCAMRVTRSSDSGPLASYHPPTSCYCKYDQVTTGNAGCATCKTATDCPASAPACSPYGFCEPQ